MNKIGVMALMAAVTAMTEPAAASEILATTSVGENVTFTAPAGAFRFTFKGYRVPSGNINLAILKPVAAYEINTISPSQIAIGWATGELMDYQMQSSVQVMPGTSNNDDTKLIFSFYSKLGVHTPIVGGAGQPGMPVKVEVVDGRTHLVTYDFVTRQWGEIWVHHIAENDSSSEFASGKYELGMIAAVYNI